MRTLLLLLLLSTTSATAQINWAQFDLPTLPGGTTTVVHDIKFDQYGDAYLPMDQAGVILFKHDTTIFYSGNNVAELQGRNIVAAEVDQNNVKWFLDGATMNLITFDGATWTFIPQSIPAIGARGWTLKMDASGNLWSTVYFPDSSYNIAKFDGNGWTFYNSLYEYITPMLWFQPLKTDALGRLVWADYHSIHWFDGINSDTIDAHSVTGLGGVITDFEIDSNNEVWMTITNWSFGGTKLAHYTGSNWVSEDLPFYFDDSKERLMLDNEGNIWIPGDNALWEKTGGYWQSIYNNADFHSTDIIVDPHQRWWFYPTDTMNYINSENFVTILDQDGINSISGRVYFDLNENGIQDAGEPPYRNQIVQLMPMNYYQITDDSGGYQFGLIDTSGTYEITLLPSANWHISSSPLIYSVTQTSNLEAVTDIDFGIAPDSFYVDAVVGASYLYGELGVQSVFELSIYNNGTTLMSGEIQFELAPQVQYVSAQIIPDQINGNTITWNYSGLFPGETKSFYVTGFIPTSVNIGDTLTSIASVTPLYDDVNPGDNSITLQKIVLSSYDPNVKTVYPQGQGASGIVLPGTTLLYTIGFQNTGNDTAHNVTIYDVLDNDFDFTSLQVIGNSNTYHVSVIEDRTLRFDFPNIMLPDSGTNEAASHGFIQYRITPLSSCPLGTVLKNEASIVFDINEPVITNYTTNTLGITTGLNEISEPSSSIEVYPNPFSTTTTISFWCENDFRFEVVILDLAGRKIKTLLDENLSRGNHEVNFNRDQLSSGIYLLQLMMNDEVVTKKLVIE